MPCFAWLLVPVTSTLPKDRKSLSKKFLKDTHVIGSAHARTTRTVDGGLVLTTTSPCYSSSRRILLLLFRSHRMTSAASYFPVRAALCVTRETSRYNFKRDSSFFAVEHPVSTLASEQLYSP
jgi:hypothetical protein